ncbi:MAG TPA: hypothetical protein VH459_12185 [Gaiellales bacterium]
MSHFPRNPWGGARLPDSTEPAGADPLAELLDTLRRPGLDDELAGGERSVARIAAAVRAAGTVDHHGRGSMASRRLRLSLTAAFAGAVLVAMSGLAYAGALPTPAQGVASDVLKKVGVALPAAHNDSAADAGSAGPAAADPSGDTGGTAGTGGTEDTGGDTGDTGGTSGSGDEGSDSGDHGKGKEISQLAHDTPAPGKGKVISAKASGGKSHAGNPPGQLKKGDGGGSHKPSHPEHPSHPSHPDHPSNGGGNGNGGHGNGS